MISELRYDDFFNGTDPDYLSRMLDGVTGTQAPAQTRMPAGDLNDWGTWFQKTAGAVVGTALNTYQYGQIAKAGGVPAVAPNGMVYTEGQQAGVGYGTKNGAGVSPLLLIGAAVAVAFLVLRK